MWKKKLAKIDKQLLHGVCIHHSCTRTVEHCRRSLKSRRCSTNVIINKNGDILVEKTDMAAACVGFNAHTVQVDLIGNFETRDIPTPEQLQSLREVIAYLCEMSCEMREEQCETREISRFPLDIRKKFCRMGDKDVREAAREYLSKGGQGDSKFFVFYHGEVRPTKCCGKNLIGAINSEYR